MQAEEKTKKVSKLSDERPSLKDTVAAALGQGEKKDNATDDVVTVAEARRAHTLRKVESNRTGIRILFVTSDRSVLKVGSPQQQYYADLAQFVGELHIMVLEKKRGQGTVLRPMKNVWVYTVTGRHSWQLVWNARQTALRHLRFNGVVQPDVLVATDPLTAGFATWIIARALGRPWQLHILVNYFTVEWLVQAKDRKRALRWAEFLLRRAPSVRTKTDAIATTVKRRIKSSVDIETLPRLFNLSAYRKERPDTLHQRYPQHPIIILAEGPYQSDSPLHDVFAAVHTLLQQGQVALLVRGSGRARHLFEEKAKLLGVTKHVIFESDDTDPVGYYQNADIFVEADSTATGDERVLRAIASTTPVVAYRNDFRVEIITDGESGFLCEPGDSYALGQKVRRLVNDSALRVQFAMRAKIVANEQLHEDVPTYYMALRDTIAAALHARQSDNAHGTSATAHGTENKESNLGNTP